MGRLIVNDGFRYDMNAWENEEQIVIRFYWGVMGLGGVAVMEGVG
jgi:hypothetical protein